MSILAVVTKPSVSAVRLQLLGGFELRVEDQVVEVKPAPQRLLALLALSGAAIERIFAAEQLYPDASRERAQANLRTTVWRLRHVPYELVTSSKTHLRLAPQVWVDVKEGLAEVQRADPDVVLRTLGLEATLLADLLPDWYDDWLDSERERIRQLRLAGLERSGERLLASGHAADGIQLGLRAAALEPLRESAQRLVIRCHLAEGNLVEAIGQYERFAALLLRELGTAPSALLTDLIRRPAPAGHGARHPLCQDHDAPREHGRGPAAAVPAFIPCRVPRMEQSREPRPHTAPATTASPAENATGTSAVRAGGSVVPVASRPN